MANSPIDDSQQTAAKVAGFAYLITFATVVYVNFGIHALWCAKTRSRRNLFDVTL
jgi:hypothetical protein